MWYFEYPIEEILKTESGICANWGFQLTARIISILPVMMGLVQWSRQTLVSREESSVKSCFLLTMGNI